MDSTLAEHSVLVVVTNPIVVVEVGDIVDIVVSDVDVVSESPGTPQERS